jgi:hypothetical protein
MGLIIGFIGLVGRNGLVGPIVQKVHSKLIAQIIGELNSEGARDSVDHFFHAAQQEDQVNCCIPFFQNIPSLQQRFRNLL